MWLCSFRITGLKDTQSINSAVISSDAVKHWWLLNQDWGGGVELTDAFSSSHHVNITVNEYLLHRTGVNSGWPALSSNPSSPSLNTRFLSDRTSKNLNPWTQNTHYRAGRASACLAWDQRNTRLQWKQRSQFRGRCECNTESESVFQCDSWNVWFVRKSKPSLTPPIILQIHMNWQQIKIVMNGCKTVLNLLNVSTMMHDNKIKEDSEVKALINQNSIFRIKYYLWIQLLNFISI